MSKRGTWYSMQLAGDAAEIHIYDIIGRDWLGEGVSAKAFIDELAEYNDRALNLHINSPGGQVFEGVSIYNALARHEPTVNVHIDGMALSIASVVAMAGDVVHIAENGMMMIHDPWTMAQGNSEDFRKEAEVLDKIKEGMISSYQQKSGLERRELSELMTAETWFSAEEAQMMGLADQITEPLKMAACFDLKGFHYRNTPQAASMRAKVLISEVEERL